jgi:hypothetical protein
MKAQVSVTWLLLIGVVMTAALFIGYAIKNNVLSPVSKEQERVVNKTLRQ